MMFSGIVVTFAVTLAFQDLNESVQQTDEVLLQKFRTQLPSLKETKISGSVLTVSDGGPETQRGKFDLVVGEGNYRIKYRSWRLIEIVVRGDQCDYRSFDNEVVSGKEFRRVLARMGGVTRKTTALLRILLLDLKDLADIHDRLKGADSIGDQMVGNSKCRVFVATISGVQLNFCLCTETGNLSQVIWTRTSDGQETIFRFESIEEFDTASDDFKLQVAG